MKLAVSNIAWNADEDPAAFVLLRAHGIRGLEIAPPRIWPQPDSVPEVEALAYRDSMAAEGLEIIAFQALLFGRNDLTLFHGAPQPCLEYLVNLGQLAAPLGAKTLVFGSPRNRAIPETMSAEDARKQAIDFFAELGGHYSQLGVALGLEPNPAAYGCNFIRNIEEAVALVRAVNSPGFRLHLDAGEMQMNEECLEKVVGENLDITAHVHASEPMLAPLGTLGGGGSGWDGHQRLAKLLKSLGYTGWVSLEMKRPESGLAGLEHSIAHLKELYL